MEAAGQEKRVGEASVESFCLFLYLLSPLPLNLQSQGTLQ